MTGTEDKSASDCCGPNAEAGADGCCASPKTGKSRLKTVLFVVIMLTALSVGTYSFWSKPAGPECAPGQNCGAGGSCCPSATK